MKNFELLLWNSVGLKRDQNILAGFITYICVSIFFSEGIYPILKPVPVVWRYRSAFSISEILLYQASLKQILI